MHDILIAAAVVDLWLFSPWFSDGLAWAEAIPGRLKAWAATHKPTLPAIESHPGAASPEVEANLSIVRMAIIGKNWSAGTSALRVLQRALPPAPEKPPAAGGTQ